MSGYRLSPVWAVLLRHWKIHKGHYLKIIPCYDTESRGGRGIIESIFGGKNEWIPVPGHKKVRG
jgi:hypothetical protein